MILTLDPGSKKAGVALFEMTGRLTAAWLATGENWKNTADAVLDGMPVSAVNVSQVAVEKMQIYDSTPLAQANACIILSLMAGRVGGLFRHAKPFEYLPGTWKGQVPKKIMVERIRKKLTAGETGRVRGKQYHDVWDAIGIGLYHLRDRRR
jgi:hypothetical protein